MITFFPEPYEDELAYSCFARYHARSGHITYRPTAEDLFVNCGVKPSPEFISPLTEAAKHAIGRYMPLNRYIAQHTMFPYYARFIGKERRTRALEMLIEGNQHFNDALRITQYRTGKRNYLRYCPMCAAADRERYGETYWHRSHQLNGVNICPEHQCRLRDSNVGVIDKKRSLGLYHAEESIPHGYDLISYISPVEEVIANYVTQVFQADLDMSRDVSIGSYLQCKIEDFQPLNYDRFWDSFSLDFSAQLSNTLSNYHQLQMTLCNQNSSTFDICLLAISLDISVDELLTASLPTDMQRYYAYQISTLRSAGKTYPQIAHQLGLSMADLSVALHL